MSHFFKAILHAFSENPNYVRVATCSKNAGAYSLKAPVGAYT